jgi:hypothetical protein
MKVASTMYEVERRAEHAARPGFRITELQILSNQKVPWHYHSNVQDTFYVIEGQLRIFLRDPKEMCDLPLAKPIRSRHVVPTSLPMPEARQRLFLVLQGIGTYDFVPLV